MKVIRSIKLFFQEGSSDKVYHATLFEEDGKYTCSVEWGRRGGGLSKGTKAVKTTRDVAEKEFDKVVREKTGKGYQEITEEVKPAAVAPPVGEGSGTRVAGPGRKKTGVVAQLLNAIEEDEAERLLGDKDWLAQQKLDGERVLMHVHPSDDFEIVATNRQGQVKPIGKAFEDLLGELPGGTILDGELVGETYWVFDLLQKGDDDLRAKGYYRRWLALGTLVKELEGDRLRVVPAAVEEKAKRKLFKQLQEQNAEGVVFKRLDSPYTGGRPASGGAHRKHKFIKSADVFITKNAGNAYMMAVLDDDGETREVGKVMSGTTNETRAQLDDLISSGERPVAEVRYLYATEDLKLFQPVFASLRDDKTPEECLLSQLVKTNRAVATDEDQGRRARKTK